MINLFNKRLYVHFIVNEETNRPIAYSIHYSKEKSIRHAKKIAKFHNLNGYIVENENMENILLQSIEIAMHDSNFRAIENLDINFWKTDYKYKEVYEYLLSIKSGGITTYSDIAKVTRNKIAKVIKALENNPLLILVPCHRVIRKDGGISGYTPLGKNLKIELLKKEGYIK